MPFNRPAAPRGTATIVPLRTIAKSDGPLWLPPHEPDSPDKSWSEAGDIAVALALILIGVALLAWAVLAAVVL